MRGVIYARYSSDNQRTESIDAQIRACNEYARKNEIEIIGSYVDEALTGTSDKRPQFQKMIKDAESKIFDCLIVHKLDRFTRDKYDSVIYKRKLKNFGVRLYSVTENLDGSPESIILESVIEGMAQYYSENLSREVMKGLRENALKAKHTGGKPPFGYDVNEEKEYVINEPEALAVKKIFEKYAKGSSYIDLMNWLNNHGFQTKHGNKFSKSALFGIFNNEKYKGVYVFNKVKRVKQDGKMVNIPHDEDEIIRIEGGLPAIVTSELWNAVQNKMVQNIENMRSKRAKENYLLTGKLYCGQCKTKMIGNRAASHGGTSFYAGYTCAGKKRGNECTKKGIKKETIENSVLTYMDEHIFTDSFISDLSGRIFTAYELHIKESTNDISLFEEKLKEIDKKLKNNMQAIEDGLYTATIKNRIQELELQKVELQKSIYDEKYKNKSKYSLEHIKEYLMQGRNIRHKDFEEQRKLVNMLIDRIYLFDDSYKIYFFIRVGKTGKSLVLDLPVVSSPSKYLYVCAGFFE